MQSELYSLLLTAIKKTSNAGNIRKPISRIMEHRLNQIPSAAQYKFLSASRKQVRDHQHFHESLQGMQVSSNNISKAEVKYPPPFLLSTSYTFNMCKAALSLQNPPSRVWKAKEINLSLKQPCRFKPLKGLKSSPSPFILILFYFISGNRCVSVSCRPCCSSWHSSAL